MEQDSSLTPVYEQGPKYAALKNQRLVMVKDEHGTAWTAEVGGGTVEVIVGPCDDLHELDATHAAAVDRLRRAAAVMRPNLRVLGMGMQPISPPSRDMIIDRQRYTAMDHALGNRNWKWFAVTASDQV